MVWFKPSGTGIRHRAGVLVGRKRAMATQVSVIGNRPSDQRLTEALTNASNDSDSVHAGNPTRSPVGTAVPIGATRFNQFVIDRIECDDRILDQDLAGTRR